MNYKDLKEIVSILTKLTTSSFTLEEDMSFIALLEEIDGHLKHFNTSTLSIIGKYKITLNKDMQPISGNIKDFEKDYKELLEVRVEIKNKISIETIIKMKNENKLQITHFKQLLDNLKI